MDEGYLGNPVRVLHKNLSSIININLSLENLIWVTSQMSGTHSKSSLASEASQTEHVEMESPSRLKTFEREDTVIKGLLSGLYKVVS